MMLDVRSLRICACILGVALWLYGAASQASASSFAKYLLLSALIGAVALLGKTKP